MIADLPDLARRVVVNVDTWSRAMLKHAPRDAGLRFTLRALATWMAHDGVAWPSQPALSEACDCTVRTIRRRLDRARQIGWIDWADMQVGDFARAWLPAVPGRWRVRVYQATVPAGVPIDDADTAPEPSAAHGLAELAAPTARSETMNDATKTDSNDLDIDGALLLPGARSTDVFVNDAGSITIRQPRHDPYDGDELVTLTADQAAAVAAELERLVALRDRWERTAERVKHEGE